LINAESNTLSLQIEEVTAYNMIYNAIQFVKYNANLQNKEVVMKPPFPDINIKTDIALLQRTLLNMLKNALEASPEQPVVIGYYADDKTVTFWVNNPTVMSDMVKSRVFQRSFSTKGADRGIGTYSMKLLTERYLQGEVTFESKEGEGTTFRAAIPLRIE
jgi:signal transduction histidine kinase